MDDGLVDSSLNAPADDEIGSIRWELDMNDGTSDIAEGLTCTLPNAPSSDELDDIHSGRAQASVLYCNDGDNDKMSELSGNCREFVGLDGCRRWT